MSPKIIRMQRLQCSASTLLLLAGIALMVYSYVTLHDMPYVFMAVMIWLTLVEYAVGRSWWVDVRELRQTRRGTA